MWIVLSLNYSLVILLSIFLSIAVDKLSEVKAVEQEEGREVEKRDRERDDKKRQIHALKHPEEASLYRKTLRSARRLFDGIRVDSNQKRDWEKPFSSSLVSSHAPLKRHLSTRSNAGVGGGVKTPTEQQTPQRESSRQYNPLRFMLNPLSLITERGEERLTERPQGSIEDLDTNQRYSIHSQSSKYTPTASTVLEDSVLSKNIRRRHSTASTPEPTSPYNVTDDRTLSSPLASYDRTQSEPVDPSLKSRVSDLSSVYDSAAVGAKALETITEDDTTVTELTTDHERSLLVLCNEL